MTRLAIGIVLGFIGLFGMGIGGALDATPVEIACERACQPTQSAAVALAHCETCLEGS